MNSSQASNDCAAIGSLTVPPISRTTLALFAGASGDHNPIHIDIDFPRAAKMDDVFAHGMLLMAYLGRLLTDTYAQTALRSFSVRFVAIAHLGESITCSGTIVERFEQDGESRVRLHLSAAGTNGQQKVTGQAVVALSV